MGFEHATFGIFIFICFFVFLILFYISKAKKQTNLYIRRIPGVDAIDEAIGRSVELGRPVSFSTGLTAISPVLYAVLGTLHYVAQKVATYKNKFFLPQNEPEVMVIVEDLVKDAYKESGNLSDFDSSNIMFLSDEQFAYAAGYMGLCEREQFGTCFLFGYFAAESLILAEAGQSVGAMQIAASISPEQVAFFICTCDYTLIGEELFASGAYLSKEPIQTGSLYAQDRLKLFFMLLIICGVLISTVNSVWDLDLKNVENLFSFELSSFLGRESE